MEVRFDDIKGLETHSWTSQHLAEYMVIGLGDAQQGLV
jgi:hypothetical protein